MNLEDVIFIDSLPTLDLHGYDKEYARIDDPDNGKSGILTDITDKPQP